MMAKGHEGGENHTQLLCDESRKLFLHGDLYAQMREVVHNSGHVLVLLALMNVAKQGNAQMFVSHESVSVLLADACPLRGAEAMLPATTSVRPARGLFMVTGGKTM